MIAFAVLAIGGVVTNNAQKELLSVGDGKTVPYLKAAEIAANGGDYKLADSLAKKSPVLGMSSESENVIWPENAVKKEIADLEEEIKQTPSSNLYLTLARDYYKLSDFDKAKEALGQAVELAPNDETVLKFVEWSKGWTK